MLQSLRILNYVLISDLEIEFSEGFSIMTGETGAGKSVILGALGLVLGQRADAKSIQQGKDKCTIEAIFDISSYRLDPFFRERDLEYDPVQCILRREIWKSGKSRAFINDSPVNLNDLKELGSYLIDIHSQHQNLLLSDNRFQLETVDILANNKAIKREYSELYEECLLLTEQLNRLKEENKAQTAEEDYLRFQFEQLERAELKSGEQTAWEEEAETLSHLEEIKSGLYRAEEILSSENGVLSYLKETLGQMRSIEKVYPAAKELAERIETAYIDLKDLSSEATSRQEKLELNPERLQEVRERLDLIYSLQKKHRLDSVEELLELQYRLDRQLREIDTSGDRIDALEKEIVQKRESLIRLAKKLTKSRKEVTGRLERELSEIVRPLGMPHFNFSVDISEKKEPGPTGTDVVAFLFSANRSEPLKPVAQTASGGEISRLMLGIKALIAGATALPSIIFDEIDTGVSGEVTGRLAAIMQRMGKVMQVISITHLPQIAAKGKNHYFVYKEETADRTETQIRLLRPEERVEEIARMLSGSEPTDAARRNAKELLEVDLNAVFKPTTDKKQ